MSTLKLKENLKKKRIILNNVCFRKKKDKKYMIKKNKYLMKRL